MSTHEQILTPALRREEERAKLRTNGISLYESWRIAINTLMVNKLRSALTALGIIIGVAAVVALLAIGRGAQEEIAETINANGANLLTIRPGSVRAGGFGSDGGRNQTLTLDDAEALAASGALPDATLVSPETFNYATIIVGSQNTSALVTGGTTTFLRIHNHSLKAGTFISEGELRGAANVAVLGDRLAQSLFGRSNPVGQYVRVEGLRFRVIGVLAPKGGGVFGSIDDGLVVPLTTTQQNLFANRSEATGQALVSSIAVQARSAERLDPLIGQIQKVLRQRHRLPTDGSGDDFSIDNQQNLLNTLTESRRTFTAYMGAIAAISLVVGGIGIMNIMLVSVRERTREIGLRKAIGARERDILNQFLIEALTLSTAGGLIGLLVGVLIAVFAEQTGRSRASVSLDSVVLAVGVAMAIGLFFGIAPARRAARLDPIEALRYE